MECIDLTNVFDREIEVLEIQKDSMIYAIDQKNEVMDVCRIGRYDFDTQVSEDLCVLDYARLYESFATYPQREDFFYAVNVLADYRLRLRRINKKTWDFEGEMVVDALGEILNIHILDERYLLIVDEVESSSTYAKEWHMRHKYTDEPYMELVYVYDSFEKKRYPVLDERMHRTIEWLSVRKSGSQNIIYMILTDTKDSLRETASYAPGGLYSIELGMFISSVTEHRPLYLESICEGDQKHSVTYFENDRDDAAWQVTDCDTHESAIYRLNMADGGICRMAEFSVLNDEDSMVYYDGRTYDAYSEKGDPAALADGVDSENHDGMTVSRLSHVECLTDEAKSFDYDTAYGAFSGFCRDNLFITTFYKKVKIKDDEVYTECTALHHRDTGAVETFEGSFFAREDKLILLRSFLYL